ncbi:MAG: hypothetical protein ACPGVB_14255 [Chitinophagales bacterium]
MESLHKIVVYQEGKENLIESESQSIEITDDKFSIRFYNKKYAPERKEFYAAQIAALTDKQAFEQIHIGQQIEDISYFGGGTGMAAAKGGYESLIINNEAHHYLFYENETSNRLKLIGQKNDNWRFEFVINSFSINREKLPLQNEKIAELYLVILIDRNLNNMIEEGELTKLTLELPN